MVESRQEKILLAVIRKYIETAEPVGSATLLQKYGLECSSATVRNEMARLEEMGFLAQPHTSAGRIPQDAAYRFYVDRLLSGRLPSPPEASTIERGLAESAPDAEGLIMAISRLLAHLTRYTALALGPRLSRSLFKYLQLAAVGPHQVLLVMMTHAGSIVHRVIEVSSVVTSEDLSRMTNLLNERLSGLSMDAISLEFLKGLPGPIDHSILERVSEATRELARSSSDRVLFEGAAHLLGQPEFRDVQKARALLEVLEEEKLLAEILEGSLSDTGVEVMIGAENRISEMHDCTMITATYRVDGVAVGSVGVLGPTRMPYDRVMSIVGCAASLFGMRLSQVAGR